MLVSKLFLKKIRRIYFLSNSQYKNAGIAFWKNGKAIPPCLLWGGAHLFSKIWLQRHSLHDACTLIFWDLKNTMIISWNVNKCWNFNIFVLYLDRYSRQIQWYSWKEHIQIDFDAFNFVNWASIPQMKWVALNWKIQQKVLQLWSWPHLQNEGLLIFSEKSFEISIYCRFV